MCWYANKWIDMVWVKHTFFCFAFQLDTKNDNIKAILES